MAAFFGGLNNRWPSERAGRRYLNDFDYRIVSGLMTTPRGHGINHTN